MRTKTKTDKGVAGLTILLSLVTMLFVIGLLVMIFSLMGGELQSATFTPTTSTVTNETNTYVNATGDQLAGDGTNDRNARTWTLTSLWASVGTGYPYNVSVPLANASVDATTGIITNGTVTTYTNTSASYTYVYDATNTATDVINDTTVGISGTTDWFDIFIVIGAMVVLILLTVIIITAIRGSGLMSGGSA